MSSERFSLYLNNLIETDLLAQDAMLILFGGEMLNHPESLEICGLADDIKSPSMRLVIITSGKFRDEFRPQADRLLDQPGLFHHWEVSIKDMESLQFGLSVLDKGHEALFRYDYLNATDLKNSIAGFFQQIKSCGIWKTFRRNNPRLEKDLRYARKDAASNPDTVIVEEFFYSNGTEPPRSVGLTFSPLDRSVLRKGGMRAPAECSLFHSQYQTAIHVTRDGSIFPCHLPRFKKRCEPMGNAADLDFLRHYPLKIEEFKGALSDWQKSENSEEGICIRGCRDNITLRP
jgi:hypothetical protein